jgi:threonine/homoserine efflux transporter RhtA
VSSRAADLLRYAAAVLVLVVGLVHLQQYVDFISEIPTIGVMFLLNAGGGAALFVALLWRERTLRQLAAVGGIALCVGSLIALVLAMGGGIFDYQESNWRGPVVVSVIAEVAALAALIGYLALGRRAAPA